MTLIPHEPQRRPNSVGIEKAWHPAFKMKIATLLLNSYNAIIYTTNQPQDKEFLDRMHEYLRCIEQNIQKPRKCKKLRKLSASESHEWAADKMESSIFGQKGR